MSTLPDLIASIDAELVLKVAAAQGVVQAQIAAVPAQLVCITSSFQQKIWWCCTWCENSWPRCRSSFWIPDTILPRPTNTGIVWAMEWGLNLVNVLLASPWRSRESQFGILNQTAPDRCCGLRKVGPLFASLEPYTLWFTGLRREQAKTRANLQVVDAFTLPTGKQLNKVSPLAEWSARDVWQHAEQQGIPLLKLYEKGYTSIGCEPCTSLPFDVNDPRSGRWGGRKQECGIHVQPE